ncbi:MAG: adenylosuccinate synthase [Chloroflexi bacterium]|nr:adenylosuccinate synthase [Chloroflexota bacterium]MCL5074532.1 adenylosuccinate synthase [Chloroflexota bacterium]
MSVTAIIGAQWGDEGKGKIIDLLAQEADFVIRFNGGANAGHTVVNEYGISRFHLIPSGIFNPRVTCIIGGGVLVDLETLLEEIESLREKGVDTTGRLLVSQRCHVVMPYHRLLDRLYEAAKGKSSVGTTGRGIGPTYADKVSYNGIRLADMADESVFAEKLGMQLSVKNRLIAALGEEPLSLEQIFSQYRSLYAVLAPFICEPFPIVQKALAENKRILLEGAQGTLLDPDWGTYPFCTASTTLANEGTSGAGIPPAEIKRVVGVVKAYTTRVGHGPMPTELSDETGELLREFGAERGVTTGRPRRCGWFDAEIARFSAMLNGFTEMALTKLDVLDQFAEIEIAVGYEVDGKRVHYVDGDAQFLSHCRPIYEKMPGWRTSIQGAKSFADLPSAAQDYVRRLEELIGVPITIVSVGPERGQTIRR